MTFIVRISHHKWSDTVSPEMHAIRCIAIFNKDNKVSCRLSHKLHHHFWREIHRIKVIKCPPNYIPWRDINSNFNPNLKITWIQKLIALKSQTGGLHIDLLSRTFHDIYQNGASCAFLDISDFHWKVLYISSSVVGGIICVIWQSRSRGRGTTDWSFTWYAANYWETWTTGKEVCV